ncbi:hypothetical protein PSTT_08076 [Puccinia striiformis]|uniref:ATPase AAA-type core domain-containing protein n=1 Tax=Puccinia striiformis TaxID=27350 RepID=A0A2S4VDY8_9BASI|nr:hypothetical protein PSTT_08076 [Puccinia striiformis]
MDQAITAFFKPKLNQKNEKNKTKRNSEKERRKPITIDLTIDSPESKKTIALTKTGTSKPSKTFADFENERQEKIRRKSRPIVDASWPTEDLIHQRFLELAAEDRRKGEYTGWMRPISIDDDNQQPIQKPKLTRLDLQAPKNLIEGVDNDPLYQHPLLKRLLKLISSPSDPFPHDHPSLKRQHQRSDDALNLLWTSVFAPTKTNEILGDQNRKNALTLKSWLREIALKDHIHNQNFIVSDTDSDTIYAQDISMTDTEQEATINSPRKRTRSVSILHPQFAPKSSPSKEEEEIRYEFDKLTNLILLKGPHGSGKTCTVHAVANDLDWEVFEVNPSSLRTQEVDIIYIQDKDFWSGVIDLISKSMRPIIMTCTDTSILPLNDLPIQSILEFESPPIELISKFMEIIGVINGHLIDRRHILNLCYQHNHQIPVELKLMRSKKSGTHQIEIFQEPPLIRSTIDTRKLLNQFQFLCQFGIGSTFSGVDWLDLNPVDTDKMLFSSDSFSMGEEIPQIMVDPFESDNNFFKKFKPSDVEVNWITTFLDDHPRHQFEIPVQLDSPVNEDHKDALLLKALAGAHESLSFGDAYVDQDLDVHVQQFESEIQICPTDNVLISNNIIDIKRVVKAVNHDDLDLGHDDVELEVQGVHTKRPFSSSHYSLDKVAFDGLVHALYSHLFNQILVALQQSSLNQDPYQYLIQYFTLFNHSELTSKRNSKLHEIDQVMDFENSRGFMLPLIDYITDYFPFVLSRPLASSSSSPSYIRPTLAPIDFNQHTRIAKRLKFDDDDDDKTIKLNTDQDFNCLSEPFLDDEHQDLPPRRTRSRIIHQSTYDPIIDFESSSTIKMWNHEYQNGHEFPFSLVFNNAAKNRAPGRPPAPEEMMATASALGTISLYNPSYKGH